MRLFPALEPFGELAMDWLGPLTTSRGGHKHVLVIFDLFTKLTRAIPLRDATALTVWPPLIDTWVASYGIRDSVLTENGPQSASDNYQGILGLLSRASNDTSPYHPENSGHVERYDCGLMRQLQCYVGEHQTDWDSHLSVPTVAYNTQVHASTAEMWSGQYSGWVR